MLLDIPYQFEIGAVLLLIGICGAVLAAVATDSEKDPWWPITALGLTAVVGLTLMYNAMLRDMDRSLDRLERVQRQKIVDRQDNRRSARLPFNRIQAMSFAHDDAEAIRLA
jgi:hypothetical protein